MKILNGMTSFIKLTEIERLDPVVAYFHDQEPGVGSVTITCYGTAWTAWWGGMGKDHTVRQFVSEASLDYFSSCLTRADLHHKRHTKMERDYLVRVCKAVQAALVAQP